MLVGLDDTIERRRGKQMQARGIDRDPVRRSRSHFVKTSGLRWWSRMLRAEIPWAGRVRALPFLTVLAPCQREDRTTPCWLALFSLVTLWASDLHRPGKFSPRPSACYSKPLEFGHFKRLRRGSSAGSCCVTPTP